MSFKSETLRVFIASPSDLTEERQAATDTVNEWNAQHAAAESVVLLPIKWETHAIPRSSVRPQEAINKQLVRGCDILIGMFWTKLGTNTGAAESLFRTAKYSRAFMSSYNNRLEILQRFGECPLRHFYFAIAIAPVSVDKQ